MADSRSDAGPTITVACAADAEYIRPLAVMLRSVLRCFSAELALTFHLAGTGIPTRDAEALDNLCAEHRAEIQLHELGAADLSGLPTWGRMSVATYHRLLLADLLPDEVKKVIWLDCDLLVRADLARLWETDLGGCHLLAVRDPLVPLVSSRYGVRRWRELGLPAGGGYFNAGVMLIDLERWREDEVGKRAAAYLKANRGSVMFWDQEGLNAVLCGRWGELDSRWNEFPGSFVREPRPGAAGEPWIVHFSGNLKPWILPRPARGNRALFYEVLDETPWAGWRPRRTLVSAILGRYEASRLRALVFPLEPWVMLFLRRRVLGLARRRAA
jgi:lipopolysaccharide biosynthesis glycosyltransferase